MALSDDARKRGFIAGLKELPDNISGVDILGRYMMTDQYYIIAADTFSLPIFNITVSGNFLPKKIKYYNSSIWINMEEYAVTEIGDAIVTEAGDYIVTTDGPTIKYYDGVEWKIFSA